MDETQLHVVDERSDSAAIRALIETYEAAVNRRDVAAAVATYTPDADSWIVGYDRVVGIEAIRMKAPQLRPGTFFLSAQTDPTCERHYGHCANLPADDNQRVCPRGGYAGFSRGKVRLV
jgi:hypothetical protein